MASQVLTRALFTTRFTKILQISGLKSKAADKIKDLKIPEKPKRPLSGYFKFAQDHRQAVQKEHPEWKMTDVIKQVALDWKEVLPTVKEKYEDEYKKELDTYSKKYTEYRDNLTNEQKEALAAQKKEGKEVKIKRERRKKIKELNKPKQPLGAFMLFVTYLSDKRGKPYKDMISVAKEEWGTLEAASKDQFLEAAQILRQKYEEELKEWEWKMIEEGHQDVVRKSTLETKPMIKKITPKDTKPTVKKITPTVKKTPLAKDE